MTALFDSAAKAGLAILAALALAGCDRSPRAPEPAPTPAPSASEAARKPVSIIRDDIAVEREAPPLAPLEVRIGFADGGAELSEAARTRLATVLDSPQMPAGGAIVLRGHSDSVGADEANLRVSKHRAEAVRDWLVGHGVEEGRITVIALGEQNPAEPNALPDGTPNEKGRAANRRVELSIAVPEGTPASRPAGPAETLVDRLAD